MIPLINRLTMETLVSGFMFRSDIHAEHSLEGLLALKERMSDFIHPDAMHVLDKAIVDTQTVLSSSA